MALTPTDRISPGVTANSVMDIISKWQNPADSLSLPTPWNPNFSRDIKPVPCHSHNDYWRQVPLYDAISAGCTSVEADIWVHESGSNDTDLLVGHDKQSLTPERTLQSLYLEPFLQILQNKNTPADPNAKPGNMSVSGSPHGIFDSSPETTMILLLDFKSDGAELWPIVSKQLEPLRAKQWLTYWESSTNTRHTSPITVVASGNAPFPLVISNNTYRDIFFDAPLTDVSNTIYTTSNSYLASTSLGKAIGTLWFGKVNAKQRKTLSTQVGGAKEKGLLARYWDTPDWPVVWRESVWKTLLDAGVGLLNVDDLARASTWKWN
jgi:hypothetical protein